MDNFVENYILRGEIMLDPSIENESVEITLDVRHRRKKFECKKLIEHLER